MTTEVDPRLEMRAELVAALAREGIAYPEARLDEAIDDYAELKRFMGLIEAAGAGRCPTEPGGLA